MAIIGIVVLIAIIAILTIMLGFAFGWLWSFYHYEDDEVIKVAEGNDRNPKKIAKNLAKYITDDFIKCVKFIFS